MSPKGLKRFPAIPSTLARPLSRLCSSRVLPKHIHERWIFQRFWVAAGLRILDGSIEQPEQDPPGLRLRPKLIAVRLPRLPPDT
jgi:hypothetical protein